ncbi:type II secretion system F family protein [Vibrio sp. Y2-5]|uniref:type II secretion system F family protein n=1 Tax=Vibrio sp. Y2-5 TaxID=2743977 RepID=UPI0016605118|nr:type II secretion system F family protein [Vibrio sp. Y2-5]MBD0787533.1 type II secretion system F family protein [Vibrio sp. Y2-5]
MQELVNYLQNFKLTEENLILLMVMFTSILVVITFFLLVFGRSKQSSVRNRLQTYKMEVELTKKNSKIDNALETLSPIFTTSNVKDKETVRHQLMHAGFHNETALTYFYVTKTLSTLIGLFAGVLYYTFSDSEQNPLFILIICVAVGLFVPNLFLRHLVKKRQSRIRAGVPDMLDLLVVCTESGLGLNAGLMRVSKELGMSHMDLADELDTVCLKIKAGFDMSEAFQGFVERTGVEELAGLISMLSHASRIGGSLSQTLRDYTEDYRDKRNQEVEEIAAKIPTKMIFPLLVCIWPGFFIVVLGPAIISLMEAFGQ